MDASVNMKMTPDEHRLIHETVQTRITDLHDAIVQGRARDLGFVTKEQARAKEAQLRSLLAKI